MLPSASAVVRVFLLTLTKRLRCQVGFPDRVPGENGKKESVGEMAAKFDVVSNFQPAGDQPQAIDKLVAGFQNGQSRQTLLGATGTGKTFTAAHVIAQLGKPALVLSHNKTLAAQLYKEFRAFFPRNAVHYFVSYYDYYQPEAYIPQRDIYIEKDALINENLDRLRLAATSALVSREDVARTPGAAKET